tara:strand:+ start:7999 stop:8748 length:750 start_codon:yes stop_codon:yes gene_type:complete
LRKNFYIKDVLVDIPHLKRIEAKACFDFQKLIKEFGSSWSIGFSAGKDSVVVAHLASRFGIVDGCCEESFCFPKDRKEMRSIANQLGLNIEFRDSLSDKWLKDKPQYIFPYPKDSSLFYANRQQKSIKSHAQEYVGLITGRRHEENSIKSELYKTSNGLWNFHPIAKWRSEDIWGYIKWKELPFLSIYESELGQLEGATPWCNISRKYTPDTNKCWSLVYNHDKPYFLNHLVNVYPQANDFYEKHIRKS